MKNFILKHIYIPVLAMILLAGCKKEKLSPIPQASLSDAVAFSSADRIAQQVNGIYSACKSGAFLGGRTHVYNDVRGEDWLNITGNGVTALGVWNYSVISTDNQVENMWIAAYAAINRANVTIEGIGANPGVVTPAVANQYIAEARFCRALCYYYLATVYARRPFNADAGASPGLPLRLTANKSSAGTAMARSTMAQTYTQVLNDLNFAEANLPANYAVADSNVVRAHRNAAIALKTRVLLHMGRYADVITEANKLVPTAAPFIAPTGVLHRLNANFTNVFRAPYTNLESIFSFPMNNTNPPGTQNGLSSYENAEFGLNAAGVVADAGWKATDTRKTLVTATLRYQKFNDDLNNYVPILRYAEVMLNLAEALARNGAGVDTRALALLNAVRQRSDATTTFAPATQTDLVNAILNERRIELLGEGFRAPDLMRLVQAFPAKSSLAALPPTALNYVWPIPASELLYNSAMTPNN
jgi:starch-binding outer membrane protein, SusD/RagB family